MATFDAQGRLLIYADGLGDNMGALWADLSETPSWGGTKAFSVTDNSVNQNILTPGQVIAYQPSSTWCIGVIDTYSGGAVTIIGEAGTTGNIPIKYLRVNPLYLQQGYSHPNPSDGYVFPMAMMTPNARILSASFWASTAGGSSKIKLWLASDCDITSIIASGGDALHPGTGFDVSSLNARLEVNDTNRNVTDGQLLWLEVDTADGIGFLSYRLTAIEKGLIDALG